MRNITTNFKLGFGSFVDKTVSPYVRTEYVISYNLCNYIVYAVHPVKSSFETGLFSKMSDVCNTEI